MTDEDDQIDGPDSSLFAEDDDYRERMERQLEETEYDTELGLEMARDAQRLVAGDISEDEFYDRYHDAVVEEFGEDSRGLDDLVAESDAEVPEDASIGEKLEAVAEGEFDRREVMKKGGAAALALGVGLSGQNSQSGGGHGDGHDDSGLGGGEGTQYGMVINLNNCDGCLACMVACKQDNNLSRGSNWMYVMAYEEENQNDENFLVRPCQHCDEAACEKVCPVGARHTREEDGLVLSDYEICIGCRYCMVACPYGVNYFQWGEPDTADSEIEEQEQYDDRDRWVDSRPPEGVMGKCTFCPTRQDGDMGEDKIGTTACEDACAMDAIHFGDLNDPESEPNQHLREYQDQQQNDQSTFPNRKDHTVSTFRLLEEKGTDPNVTYIGNEPSENAHQVEGPVAYEDMGLVDNRKDQVLNQGAAANENGGEEA